MVTKLTLLGVLGLLISAAVAQGRILAYDAAFDTETAIQAQLATTAPSGAQQATVRQVVGIAQARKSENDAWQAVKVGQVYDEGAEFRTGIRSRVVFSVPPDQTIILDRLGVVKLLIAKREGNEVRTSLGMPYGRTEYQVEEAGLQHNADIASPGATLAVRGTKNMHLFDQGPFTPVAYASQPVRLRNSNGQTISFGKAGARTHVAADKHSPGEQSLVEQRVDPAGNFSGRTQSENAVLSYLSRVAPDLDISKFRLLSLSTDPIFKGSGIGTLPIPGQLRFTLFWTTAFLSDLDLTVISPLGEVVSFTNPNARSSGHHTGDEVSIKGQGQEVVIWQKGYPQGKYTIMVTQKGSAKGASSATVDVVSDPTQPSSKRVALFQKQVSDQKPSFTKTVIIGPPAQSSAASSSRRK
jgi:hypothetical protein